MPLAGSYVDKIEADAYLGGHPSFDSWNTASAGVQERYLKTASRRVDALPLIGQRYDPDQSLEFPRRYVDWSTDADTDNDGNPDVPERVKDAVCEEAIALYLGDTAEKTPILKNVSVEGISFSLADTDIPEARDMKGLASLEAFRIMERYISDSTEVIRL